MPIRSGGMEIKMKGFFGDLFDFNKNGKLDPAEQAMDFMAFNQVMNDINKTKDADNDNNDDQN